MKATICAIDSKGNFGNNNGTLPWGKPIKEDMILFMHYTGVYKNCVMGVETFRSLPMKLKERVNIVVARPHTNINDIKAKNGSKPDLIINWAHSQEFEKLDSKLKANGFENYIVIGGTNLIKKAIDSKLIDEVYLSVIEGDHKADIKVSEPETKLKVISSHLTNTNKGRLVFYKMTIADDEIIKEQ